jgi:hypothetical protein
METIAYSGMKITGSLFAQVVTAKKRGWNVSTEAEA